MEEIDIVKVNNVPTYTKSLILLKRGSQSVAHGLATSTSFGNYKLLDLAQGLSIISGV